jgi:transposase-like protein
MEEIIELHPIVRAYQSGHSVSAIARDTNKSVQAVSQFLKRRGIEMRRPKVRSVDDERMAREVYRTGVSVAEVVRRTGLSESVVRASNVGRMRTSSESLSLKKGRHLDHHQTQCVLGTLLGDSSIGKRYLTMVHCEAQEEYLRYKNDLLGGPKVKIGRQRPGSYSAGSKYFRIDYCNKIGLDPIRKIVFGVNGKKRVTEKWLSNLDAEGVAYWFMDDGSSSWTKSGKPTCSIATYGFDLKENLLLIEKLKSMGVDARLHKSQFGFGWKIGVPVSGSQYFLRLVEPTISKIPCMRYKLKLVKAKEAPSKKPRLQSVIHESISNIRAEVPG